MQKRTSKKSRRLNAVPESAKPKKNPIIAKGRANTVCANFTREKYLETVEITLIINLSIEQNTLNLINSLLLSSVFLQQLAYRS
jgi:hypothetical protein